MEKIVFLSVCAGIFEGLCWHEEHTSPVSGTHVDYSLYGDLSRGMCGFCRDCRAVVSMLYMAGGSRNIGHDDKKGTCHCRLESIFLYVENVYDFQCEVMLVKCLLADFLETNVSGTATEVFS